MKYDIEKILTMYEDDYNPSSTVLGPQNMRLVEILRSEMDNFNTPDLEQAPDSYLKPGETLEDFDVEFRRPNADGGRLGFDDGRLVKNKKRLKQLNKETALYTDGRYKTFESVPDYKLRQTIGQRATLRAQGKNVGGGSGSPGVPRPVGEDFVSPMKDARIAAKKKETTKLNFQKSDLGKRLQWIANNGKNYNNTKNFIKAYEKHFNHKIGSKKDVLFNTAGKKPLTQIDNLINTGRPQQDLFTLTFKDGKAFNQEELFKASIIQNNPDIQKEFKTLFKDVHKNVSVFSELGPEGLVENLNKGKLFKEFDFVKFGVGSGITRNSLLKAANINPDHLTSYQNVRRPLLSISQIIESLKNPSFAKGYGISPTTAKKIRGQLNNFFEGEKGLQADIRKINNQLGDVKFNNIFGGVNFEHTLAKAFGKDYKYLPRNYLLKGQFTSKAFNMMKRDVFDLPLIDLMKKYEKGEVSGAKVQKFINDFNAKTNNYADFSFDLDKGKLGYTDTQVSYDLSRYNDPDVARKELMDNIKLTQSDTFQQGMKGTIASGDQLKLFKSKEAKEILSKLEKLGCGRSAGGRILMSNGGPTKCALKGRKVLEEGLKNGFKKGNQQVLAEGILKSGRFLKDAVSLRGLFGPAALAFTVAAEAGIVGYDMLSTGKSFREAIGDSIFNYALGDKTKIDSDEEFMKRLKNITVGPQGYQRMSDEQIGKMLNFKANLDDMYKGFDLYNQLKDLEGLQEIRDEKGNIIVKGKAGKILDNQTNQAIDSEFFSDNAFNLDAEKDALQADIRDYNKTGTPQRVTNFMLSPKAEEGAKAAEYANLLVKQDQLKDAGTAGVLPKIDQGIASNLKETKYDIENLFKKPDPFRQQFMSLPKGEQSTIMSYGYPRYMEGGIASLNVNKK